MCTTYSLERRRCKVDGNHCEKITNVQQRSAVDSRRCLTIDTQAAAGPMCNNVLLLIRDVV